MFRRSAKELEIDVSQVDTAMALHILLEKAFEFPAYYGRNWDAFDERVRDVPLPVEI